MTTTTFLFTDIEGSTRLWERHPQAMEDALAEHDRVAHRIVDANRGRIFKHMGDGIAAVFPSPDAALDAAAEMQRSLTAAAHPEVGALRVRMGVHAGDATEREGDYFGLAVTRTARIMDAGHGGQVLASEIVAESTGRPLLDLGEHRLRDLTRAERIYQLATEDLPGDFPPLRTIDVAPNNLPTLPTSFVGRARELEDVEELVAGSRLVTVTGVGGSGKTRIALQAAADLSTRYPGGVWLVELAAVSDPELVDAAVLTALGLEEPTGASPIDAIVEHLQGRVALLLIDNCEHLIDAASVAIGKLLRELPELTVVATSRELLGVPGEMAYGLRSMGLPPEGSRPEAVLTSDAGRLFAERAIASKPGFTVTDETAPAIAEICRRLDGMPLALELAAARIRSFGPVQIAEHLDQRFRLLTGGSRTALPRQQTLTATIDWSYRLLAETEQALFRRLSVFQGGFSFESVEEVCPGGPLDRFDILELLPGLVDKSLVVADDRDGDEVRYRLLETIRQFARDRLDETGEADDWRHRHAEFFASFAQLARSKLDGAEASTWLRRLGEEADNLRQAMTWSLEAGHIETAFEALRGFANLTVRIGRYAETARLAEAIVAVSDGLPDHRRADARYLLGTILGSTSRQKDAVRVLSESVDIFRDLAARGASHEELTGMPGAINNLALALFHQGHGGERNEKYIELVTEALQVAERLDDRHAVALLRANLAHHRDPQGDPDEARKLFAAADTATREIGSTERLAGLATQRAHFEFQQREFESARDWWNRAIDLAEKNQLSLLADLSRVATAATEVELGTPEAAGTFETAVRAFFEEPDRREDLPTIQTFLGFHAGVSARRERFQDVAVADGAAGVIRDRGVTLRWDLVDHVERAREMARSALDDDAYLQAAARGAAMTLEEIVSFLQS